MKITEIKRNVKKYDVFEVTFKPNWLEKLFGVKEKTKQYKSTGNTYWVGDGNVYVDQKGNKLGNGDWIGKTIDKWRRQF